MLDTPTTYLSSLQSALHNILRIDKRVYVLGEDILDPYGGAFKVTSGLSNSFPSRVITTPICEAGFTGVAAGMALRGFRPIVEIMFGDFMMLCMDQIINHITKFREMYNNQVEVPLVIRTPMGGGRGYGATHSQSLEKFFLGVPGLHVIAPSIAHEPGMLLQHATLKDNNPVLFVENKSLYSQALFTGNSTLSLETINEIDGYPSVIIKNYSYNSPDITIITYGGTSRILIPLLEKMSHEEINIIAVIPASLKPIPLNTLVQYSRESRRIIIIEEGTSGFNYASEISCQLYSLMFNQLIKPIKCLASLERIIPAAKHLEDQVIITEDKIEKAILEILV